MPLIDRPSLPEEFYDITSAMLLVQPDPQFFHAMLFKMALGAAMAISGGGPLGLQVGTRPIQDQGAAYSGVLYDRLMLATPDPVYSQAIMVVPEIAQGSIGHTVRINRPKFGSGGFTLASREVPQGATISTNAIDLSSEQVSLTLKRYAGPYDSTANGGAGGVAPFAVDKLDASRAVHSVSQIVGKHLQRDLDRWLDQVFVGLGNLGATTLWPSGYTADNGSQVAGDMQGDVDTIFRAEETLKLANIPRFANGRYMAVISPTYSRQIKNDPQYIAFAKYFPQKNPLYTSYIATIGGIDLFESTTLTSTVNSNAVPVFTSQVFGPNFLGAGCSRLPEVQPNTQDNFGESALVIWLTYMAFTALDNRFSCQLHTS
jgi:hypothetical protein